MKTTFPLLLILVFLIQNCQPINPPQTKKETRTEQVQKTATAYFNTFSERQDWEKLCSFYREDLEFEDVLLQIKLDSLWKFKRFYNWPDTNFHKLTPDQNHLTINNLVTNDSVAVAQGRVNPYFWHGQKIDTEWGMDFTIWLYFDDNLKIRKQIDWFEYDPVFLEAVIARFRKQGVEKLPDWLDLSRE